MIEDKFDIPFIARLAHKEKQIQQSYRPYIAMHKWFARRPGTLFRGMILSEFADGQLQDAYYNDQDLSSLTIADPFMGGGTPLIEANRLGCTVHGSDINPMSFWIVQQALEGIDLDEYEKRSLALRAKLQQEVGNLYETECLHCGNDVPVKYFLWVKTIPCDDCSTEIDLFPGYLVSQAKRHPKQVFVCAECGDLNEVSESSGHAKCQRCDTEIVKAGPAKRGVCRCAQCGHNQKYSNLKVAPTHRLFAIEYHCHECKQGHTGRFFKKPDSSDLEKVETSKSRQTKQRSKYIPDDCIPAGDETTRLLNWGYRKYSELFNARQLLALELSARIVHQEPEKRIRHALATNFSDLLRYQNMLCRYDTMALKSLDIFSVHGFPVGLVQCESNILGIARSKSSNVAIGSGGWLNIVNKFAKAKQYCDKPFEVKHSGKSKEKIFMSAEWIGDSTFHPSSRRDRNVHVSCSDSAIEQLKPASVDAVFTDPPYLGNVQYAELMDFCFVWIRKLVGDEFPEMNVDSTRNLNELTENVQMGRGSDHFAEGLSKVFQNMAKALKPNAPLAFTYHHNDLEAYLPVALAILDADLECTASLPSPAEMGASIHINGTKSSIIDSVIVCRKRVGSSVSSNAPCSIEELDQIIQDESSLLAESDIRVSQGDMRCMTYGHLVRCACLGLISQWDKTLSIVEKMRTIREWLVSFTGSSNLKDFKLEEEKE